MLLCRSTLMGGLLVRCKGQPFGLLLSRKSLLWRRLLWLGKGYSRSSGGRRLNPSILHASNDFLVCGTKACFNPGEIVATWETTSEAASMAGTVVKGPHSPLCASRFLAASSSTMCYAIFCSRYCALGTSRVFTARPSAVSTTSFCCCDSAFRAAWIFTPFTTTVTYTMVAGGNGTLVTSRILTRFAATVASALSYAGLGNEIAAWLGTNSD
mmetsp:Transcript_7853/g.15603  ORF Transcript_7853/g.15603 Transcript_7853/m.15603 type:complete len:212 (+) Transcript_7853:366-1001(+)